MTDSSANQAANVVIIDTGCANLSSVKYAVERLGYPVVISKEESVIRAAKKVFLPGVGAAPEAMKNLQERNLVNIVRSLTQPVLGICLGMQMMNAISEETTDGTTVDLIGLTSGEVKLMTVADGQRLPHMGWNAITPDSGNPLFKNIEPGTYFYFVHSFAVPVFENTIATCEYGAPFSAAICKDNFYGVQFHPERSSTAGAQVLKNFLEL